jgi:hypothetical protein
MASILRNQKGHRDVIAAGVFTFSQETLVMLYDWADKIIVVDAEIEDRVHPEYKEKVLVLDMGADPWGPQFNPMFKERAEALLERAEL